MTRQLTHQQMLHTPRQTHRLETQTLRNQPNPHRTTTTTTYSRGQTCSDTHRHHPPSIVFLPFGFFPFSQPRARRAARFPTHVPQGPSERGTNNLPTHAVYLRMALRPAKAHASGGLLAKGGVVCVCVRAKRGAVCVFPVCPRCLQKQHPPGQQRLLTDIGRRRRMRERRESHYY